MAASAQREANHEVGAGDTAILAAAPGVPGNPMLIYHY
jgi:hypothetical protein